MTLLVRTMLAMRSSGIFSGGVDCDGLDFCQVERYSGDKVE